VDTVRVVVGVDGSPGARAALEWAMADAARRSATLDVVSAVPVEIYWGDPVLIDERRVEAARAEIEGRVRALVEEIRPQSGGAAVDVEVVVVTGPATHAVLAAAERADLLVVGSRGRGAVRSTLLGSVALHAATHARCPVVVVHLRPDAAAAAPRVVVGVDGSAASREALVHAVAEAQRRNAEVRVIAAFTPRTYWSGAYEAAVPPVERLEEAIRSRADQMVAEVGAAVTVAVEPVEEAAGEALVRAAEGAQLLVVGNRGRGAIRGMLLGSVALHCVVHAPCPVMVVRSGRPGDSAGTAVG
jgi:nucleotide-binding universal stress UspA family protein